MESTAAADKRGDFWCGRLTKKPIDLRLSFKKQCAGSGTARFRGSRAAEPAMRDEWSRIRKLRSVEWQLQLRRDAQESELLPHSASAEPTRISPGFAAFVGEVVQLFLEALFAFLKFFEFRISVVDDDDILREASRRIE